MAGRYQRQWYGVKKRRKKRIRRICLILLFVVLCGAGIFVYGSYDFYKGGACMEKQQYKEAAVHYQKSVKKGYHTTESYRALGFAFTGQEDYDKALQYFEKALEYGTEKDDILCQMMGLCLMKQERYQEAVEIYTEGLALVDCSDSVYREMGRNRIIACERTGRWDEAKEYTTGYLERYPDDESVIREAAFLKTR